MTSNAKLAICMPVYNGENYVEKTIKSILAQTRQDFVFIISDNASTDRTEQICRDYAKDDNRILYHRNKTNLGINGNGVRVVELSRPYPYFSLIGHDDLLAPKFVETLLTPMEKDDGISLSFCKNNHIDEVDKVISHREYVASTSTIMKRQNQSRLKRMMIQSSACLIHGIVRHDGNIKDIFEKRHGVFEDVLYLRYMAGKGRFYLSDEALFSKRIHKAKYSSSKEHQSLKDKQDLGLASRTLKSYLGLSDLERACVHASMVYYFKLSRPIKGQLARFKTS